MYLFIYSFLSFFLSLYLFPELLKLLPSFLTIRGGRVIYVVAQNSSWVAAEDPG